jgi:hypothetical protein
MSYFCYVIENPDGSCLYLSDEGPRQELPDFLQKLKQRGFHHQKEHPLGEHILRVYKRAMPATDIVPEDRKSPVPVG